MNRAFPSPLRHTYNLCEPGISQLLVPNGVRLRHGLVRVHPQVMVEGSAERGGGSVGVAQLPHQRGGSAPRVPGRPPPCMHRGTMRERACDQLTGIARAKGRR